MTLGAHVGSVDALLRLRAAMHAFIATADKALCESSIEIDRTADWIAHDRQAFWTSEIRKRHDAVVKAQDEVRRAQWTIGDHKPGAIEQKKALKKAQERLEEAKQKIANVARWKRDFAQAANEYKGQVQHISSALDADLPRAVGALDQAIDTIGAYLAVEAPAGAADDIPGIESAGASMAQPVSHGRRRALEAPDERAALIAGLVERAKSISRNAVTVTRGWSLESPLRTPDFPIEIAKDAVRHQCRPGDLIVFERAALALDRHDLFLFRLPDAGLGDSGWYVGRIEEPDEGVVIGTTAARIMLLRPDWRDALQSAPGTMLLVREGVVDVVDLSKKENES